MPQGKRDPRSWTTDAILALVEPQTKRLIRRAITGSGIGGDAINHDDLEGFVADEHIDWTGATEDFLTSGTVDTGELTVTGDIIVTGLVDDRHIAADGVRLDDLIEDINDDSMLSPIGLSMGDLTAVTANTDGETYFLYLGRALRAISSATFLTRVTTAAVLGFGNVSEIGVFTGEVVANGSASLSLVGFTNSPGYDTTGVKATTISLSGVSKGDGIWLAWYATPGFGGTMFELRGMLADDIQSGVFQQFTGRLSAMSVPSTTTLVSATLVPAWARLKI